VGSKGRAEAGVLWWWRDGACCGNKQPETEINPASVICRQLPLFVPHQIGRFRPLPRTHDFIICLGGKLTHFGSLIPTPSPLFFYATKVPRDGACQLGGPAGVGANPQVRRSWGSGVFWGIPARGFRLSDPTGSTAEHRRAVVFNSGQPARLMGRRRWPKRPSEVDPGPRTGTPNPPEDSRTKTKEGGDAWDGTGI
jgi:hypothetical protein